jgi:hypothetical protein
LVLPVQLLADGVTTIVAVTGALVVLVAVNAAMLPVPLAARPLDVVLLVQLYVVPLTAPLKFTAVVVAPLHNAWLDIVFTTGVGFTVIVNVPLVPVQPFADGVTVIVAVTGTEPVFAAANEDILPVPFAARPIDGVLLVQL